MTYPYRRRKVLPLFGLACAITGVLFGINANWQWLQDWLPWLPRWPIDRVLAFVAIIFAFIQFVDARIQESVLARQERALGTQEMALEEQQDKLIQQKNDLQRIAESLKGNTSSLREIADSLYTQFVGKFPDNIRQIHELIARVEANQSVKIIVDYPRYGEYSSPSLCDKYTAAIDQAIIRDRQRHAEVQIICYNNQLAARTLQDEFPDDENAFKSRAMQPWARYFQHYCSICPPDNFSGLRSTLLEHDDDTFRYLRDRGVAWRFHTEPAAFFLWILDDREVIFTFNNMGTNDVGLSFQTRDKSLVNVFCELFKRRWEKADAAR